MSEQSSKPVPSQEPVYVTQTISPDVSSTGTIALVLEIAFGLFGGALGIGNIYAKRTGLGIGLIFGWWVYIAIAVTVSVFTLGLAAICFGVVGLVIPIISGIMVRNHVITNGIANDSSDLIRTVAIGIGLFMFICFASVGIMAGLGVLSSLFAAAAS